MNAVIKNNRRFTCLSPYLVRMEFSPDGNFEDRPSLLAASRPEGIPFEGVTEQGDQLVLKGKFFTLFSGQNDRDFFAHNLRVNFPYADRTQTWRFGDRDYRNLGGAVRSLDYYSRENALQDVHPAGTESPNDYLHTDDELLDIFKVYLEDDHYDWQMEIMRQGLQGALKHTPELVYNRYRNLAGDLGKYQPGVLSRNGYFLLDDSKGAVLDEKNPKPRNTPGARDLYFFAYGNDFRAAMKAFIDLTGQTALPAKDLFGIIFSRWPCFDDAEARTLVQRFETEGIPLSLLMLDLEWHIPDFSHWDWDLQQFPDPQAFLDWAHTRQLLIGLNVHPQYLFSSDSHLEAYAQAADVAEKVQPLYENPMAALLVKSGADKMLTTDLANPAEAQAIKSICCEPLLKQGVDFWWVDGASSALNGADGQLLTTRIFHQSMQEQGRRPLLQSRYGGLGSHRYGIHFTGDTESQWEVLAVECEFSIRAGQVGMAFVSHDVGGFNHAEAPIIDPNLYIRWLQFGVFSPILRFHSAPGSGSRQPWDYGDANFKIARRWLQYRKALMPYLYSHAVMAHETGVPLVRGVYFDYPEDEAAYRFDEYLLGEYLLVAPLLTPSNHRSVYLPDGQWYELNGPGHWQGGQTINVYADLSEVPVYVRAGSIVPLQESFDHPGDPFVAHLLLDIYPDADGEALLYEDEGEPLTNNGFSYSRTCFRQSLEEGVITISGEGVQGKVLGDEREIRLRVALARPPAQVFLNGQLLKSSQIKFDSEDKRASVMLGPIPSEQCWTVAIHPEEA